MRFSDVIGQGEVKRQLRRMTDEGRLPHALLFAGPEGSGKLPMALALAHRLLCQKPTPEGEPCGACAGCRMTSKLAHPDLHFSYPVVRSGTATATQVVSTQYINEWREQVASSPYFSLQQWLRRIGVENQQSLINVAEANRLIDELSRVSSQGGYRVVVIWNADRMNEATANKMLKVLEEPPQHTVFILTTSHPERILATILSRTQRIDFPPLAATDIASALQNLAGLDNDDALCVARASDGNFIKACEEVTRDADTAQYFDMFVLFMRLCYMRKIRDLNEWAANMASWGREKQKAFLEYAQRLIRENFMYNFQLPELNYMTRQESDFSKNFARFVNERNVIGLMEELSLAQRDIAQNANGRMVFFDLALKVIMLLKQQ